MVLTGTYGIDKDSWYRQGLMVLTTPMVMTKTHAIKLVVLNHILMRGPSLNRIQDFFLIKHPPVVPDVSIYNERKVINFYFFFKLQKHAYI